MWFLFVRGWRNQQLFALTEQIVRFLLQSSEPRCARGFAWKTRLLLRLVGVQTQAWWLSGSSSSEAVSVNELRNYSGLWVVARRWKNWS